MDPKYLFGYFFKIPNLKKLLSYLKSTISNLFEQKKSFVYKKKKKWNQECLIWVFWAAIFKTCCHIWSQRPKICPIAMFGTNIKTLKFRTKKILDFGIFGLQFDNNVVIKMGIFRLEFQKTNIRFEVNTLKFV